MAKIPRDEYDYGNAENTTRPLNEIKEELQDVELEGREEKI
jgi:hypothetical protein